MRTPNKPSGVRRPSDTFEPIEGRDPILDHRLAEIDTILSELATRDRNSAAAAASELDDQQSFLSSFALACREEVRPAMEAVLQRLTRAGGGGLIEAHQGVGPRFSAPRLTLWMSLQGEVTGRGRPDRNPYLQLDADVVNRQVTVTEGDMWRRAEGGHSGRNGAWQLQEVTRDRIIEELLAILRRSAPSLAHNHPTGSSPDAVI